MFYMGTAAVTFHVNGCRSVRACRTAFFLVPKPRLFLVPKPGLGNEKNVSRHGKPGLPRQVRSQAGAWEREKRLPSREAGASPASAFPSRGLGTRKTSPVTGSRGFPGKCVPKQGLGNEGKFNDRIRTVVRSQAATAAIPNFPTILFVLHDRFSAKQNNGNQDYPPISAGCRLLLSLRPR